MATICSICERNFASSFNLRRHMETAHVEQADNETETESISESEDESDNEKSENSDKSEDSDNYTYAEVRAIIRYVLKSSES